MGYADEVKGQEVGGESKGPEVKALAGKKRGAGSALGIDLFDAQRQSLFVSLLSKNYLNVYKTCKQVGIHPQTYYNHLKSNPKFAQAVIDARQSQLDHIEAVAVRNAGNAKRGFLDRAMVLRAHRPELYDRAKVVRVEGVRLGAGEAEARKKVLGGVIDAEIVQTIQGKTEQRKAAKALAAGRKAVEGQGEGGGSK